MSNLDESILEPNYKTEESWVRYFEEKNHIEYEYEIIKAQLRLREENKKRQDEKLGVLHKPESISVTTFLFYNLTPYKNNIEFWPIKVDLDLNWSDKMIKANNIPQELIDQVKKGLLKKDKKVSIEDIRVYLVEKERIKLNQFKRLYKKLYEEIGNDKLFLTFIDDNLQKYMDNKNFWPSNKIEFDQEWNANFLKKYNKDISRYKEDILDWMVKYKIELYSIEVVRQYLIQNYKINKYSEMAEEKNNIKFAVDIYTQNDNDVNDIQNLIQVNKNNPVLTLLSKVLSNADEKSTYDKDNYKWGSLKFFNELNQIKETDDNHINYDKLIKDIGSPASIALLFTFAKEFEEVEDKISFICNILIQKDNEECIFSKNIDQFKEKIDLVNKNKDKINDKIKEIKDIGEKYNIENTYEDTIIGYLKYYAKILETGKLQLFILYQYTNLVECFSENKIIYIDKDTKRTEMLFDWGIKKTKELAEFAEYSNISILYTILSQKINETLKPFEKYSVFINTIGEFIDESKGIIDKEDGIDKIYGFILLVPIAKKINTTNDFNKFITELILDLKENVVKYKIFGVFKQFYIYKGYKFPGLTNYLTNLSKYPYNINYEVPNVIGVDFSIKIRNLLLDEYKLYIFKPSQIAIERIPIFFEKYIDRYTKLFEFTDLVGLNDDTKLIISEMFCKCENAEQMDNEYKLLKALEFKIADFGNGYKYGDAISRLTDLVELKKLGEEKIEKYLEITGIKNGTDLINFLKNLKLQFKYYKIADDDRLTLYKFLYYNNYKGDWVLSIWITLNEKYTFKNITDEALLKLFDGLKLVDFYEDLVQYYYLEDNLTPESDLWIELKKIYRQIESKSIKFDDYKYKEYTLIEDAVKNYYKGVYTSFIDSIPKINVNDKIVVEAELVKVFEEAIENATFEEIMGSNIKVESIPDRELKKEITDIFIEIFGRSTKISKIEVNNILGINYENEYFDLDLFLKDI